MWVARAAACGCWLSWEGERRERGEEFVSLHGDTANMQYLCDCIYKRKSIVYTRCFSSQKTKPPLLLLHQHPLYIPSSIPHPIGRDQNPHPRRSGRRRGSPRIGVSASQAAAGAGCPSRRACACATSSIVVPCRPSACRSSLKSCGLEATRIASSTETRPAFTW